MKNNKYFVVKNFGIDLVKEEADRNTKDWIFGAKVLTGLAEGINFEEYLPKGEIQRGVEDMMDCATRSVLNILETKFTYLVKNKLISEANISWLKEKGYCDEQGNVIFADAFTAIKSGTSRTGNSLKAPCESVRVDGLYPKKLMPLESWMTWDDFHNRDRVTPATEDLGKDFLKRFIVNYDIVYENKYSEVLNYDMIDTAGYAWPEQKNGIYPRVDYAFNHAFAAFGKFLYKIFDNYVDSFDGDFIKQLAYNYNLLGYSYRLIINEIPPIEEEDNTMAKKQIEVFKRKDTPDYLIRGKSGNFHRIGNEETFKELFGDFTTDIEEVNIAEENIGSPIYLIGSFIKAITKFFTNLKGK